MINSDISLSQHDSVTFQQSHASAEINFSLGSPNHRPICSVHLYPGPADFIFLSRLVHHIDNAVNHIINFLFLVPVSLLAWQNPVGKTVQIVGNNKSQLGTQHSPEIMRYFCG